MIRVADYIMQRLSEIGCRHIFMITGRGMLYLSDAVAREENLQGVSMHNEQALAYAAMAYAQVNGNIGAALVSTGCASTNAMTGCLCAWQDDVPCIFISGQNKLEETTRYSGLNIRTYGQQEADIISLVKPITKYATMITKPEEIAIEMDKALHLMTTGRKGPVWIDVPLDVQNMRVEPEALPRYEPEKQKTVVLKEEARCVAEALSLAQRPVVLIGSGIRSAGATQELHTFLQKNKIPAVYAHTATDVINTADELVVGCVGAMGANRAANFAVQNSDVLLVIGSRLSSMVVGSDIDKFAREAKIFWVDLDANEFKKYQRDFDRLIVADAKDFLQELNLAPQIAEQKIWTDKCKHWKKIFPKCEERYQNPDKTDLYYLAEVLGQNLHPETVFVCDAGLEELIMPTTMTFDEKKRCLHPASQGAMGYALPAAIGAYYASGKDVVTVIGDGSVMMNLQELQTIAHHQLPIKIIIANNNCYAVIRKRQQDLFRTRTIGTDAANGVSCPDFAKVAGCFGLEYVNIATPNELDAKLKQVLQSPKAVLCEVMCPEEQTYLHSSYRRNKQGLFVQPPLEDQSPFLNREMLAAEMIITPLD